MCKCSILTAIASGYAGRDPQGGCNIPNFLLFISFPKEYLNPLPGDNAG